MQEEIEFVSEEPKDYFRTGDALLNQVTRLGLSPIVVGLLYTLLLNILMFYSAFHHGYLRTVGEVVGFFDDPSFYTLLITSIVVIAYYAWIPKMMYSMFAGLFENGAIGGPKNIAEESSVHFMAEIQEKLQEKKWVILAVAAAAAIGLGVAGPQYFEMGMAEGAYAQAWYTVTWFGIISSVLWMIGVVYALAISLAHFFISLFFLRRLFNEFNINIKPLFPDQAGGLGPLGQYALQLVYLIAYLGLSFVTTPITRGYVEEGLIKFSWTPDVILLLVAYGVMAPVVFFTPLNVAHKAMKEAKRELLLHLSKQYDFRYKTLFQFTSTGTDSLDQEFERLENLKTIYEITNKFPVWPFNLDNILRFGGAYITPLLLSLLSTLLIGSR